MSGGTSVNHGTGEPEDPQKTLPADEAFTTSPISSTRTWCPEGYEILGRLGAGGNGQVFKAMHRGLERIVALKRLINPAANRVERERFLAEARAVARLDHPNIIRIHDFGIHDSVEWYSLEFCQRGSLADRLREGPMPLETSCQSILTVARAVGYAHSEGIIHRDIKPGNVLIANGNILKLADFGLAKVADTRHSGDNAIAGTPAYMAPEQINDPARIGPATDVWALGVMLYECLTGRVPFTGVTVLQVMQRISGAEPVAPRMLNDAIPPDLNTICLHALRKDSDKRYRTSGEMAADLEAWLEGRPIAVRAVTRLERGLKWTRRNPALAWSLGTLAATIIVGTSLSVGFGLVALRESLLLKQEQVRSSHALAEARRLERLSRLSAAQAAWDKFQWQRFLGLIATEPAGESPLFEESLWRQRARLDRQALKVSSRAGVSLIAHRGPGWPFLLSDAGGKARLVANDDTVSPLEHETPASALESSSDGRSWILTNSGEIVVFSAQGKLLRATVSGPWQSMAVAPIGEFVVRSNDRAVEILDQGFRPVQTFTGQSPRACWADAAPVAAISWATPRRIDIFQMGQNPRSVEGVSGPFALSPDGAFLVAGSDGKIFRWNTATGQKDPAFEPRLGPCRFLRFSADGSRLMCAGGTEIRLLDGNKGRGLQFWMTPGTTIEGAELAADGRRCLTWGDGIAQLWDLETGDHVLFRGVVGPVRADWQSGAIVHPSMSGESWEKRLVPREPMPRKHQLEGWNIQGLACEGHQWLVRGTRRGAPAVASLGSDGTSNTEAVYPEPQTAIQTRFRLVNGIMERLTDTGWEPFARRASPILAWAEDQGEEMIGLATENGRVERIDGRTGTPIWEEAGPVSPVAMAMGKGGVGVAASGGSVWIWQVR